MSDGESSPADYGGYEDTSNYNEPDSYSYTATDAADNWTEQHEVTTLSFSDEPREERSENRATEDASRDFAESNDATVDGYRPDDVAVPIGYTPMNEEYVTNNHITTNNHYHQDNYHRDYSHPRYHIRTTREYADWEIDWALKILQVLIGVVCIFVPVALVYKYHNAHHYYKSNYDE